MVVSCRIRLVSRSLTANQYARFFDRVFFRVFDSETRFFPIWICLENCLSNGVW